MKSLFVILTFLLGLNSILNAQEKTSIGILKFTYDSNTANAENAASIQEKVMNAFVMMNRFNIVERSKMAAIQEEKNLQQSGDFSASTLSSQGNSIGAKYLILGHVLSAKAERMVTEKNGRDKITYKAKLSVNIKLIDVATGKILVSQSINPKSGGSLLSGGSSSAAIAVSKAIERIEKKVEKFIRKNLPVKFSIAEIQEKNSKGAAKKLLIVGGSDFGLKKGDKLKVLLLSIKEVNGRKIERKQEIGKLKIRKVEDENFSSCSVISGGLDINAKFESKASIELITID